VQVAETSLLLAQKRGIKLFVANGKGCVVVFIQRVG
jgi:hypothetical protein